MSDDYESNDSEEKKIEETEDKTEEEEEGELPPLSLQDIELLMKNTEVWDDLISGKISVEEAKKLFTENYTKLSVTQKKKVSTNSKKKKSIKTKSKKKKEQEESEEEE
ncbi:RNA polymerase Rpo13 [Acidianus sulfidivorans JP7]|uniref:RNA polymerase Rpo13 n=1 Tax=Acidianus sulfidivorans JP7 TaxID=619593 RepID=A0A2U9IMG8_9CREN|nr:RNA polymerase subunit Rpo13 [Acidianus sulfidivorans]AWR97185.1 RNA polymerase Rpo13 [Acidianus sulfidivorans JP7]